MKQFFSQIEDIQIDNSVPNSEAFFCNTNSSGLMEKQLYSGLVGVLLFAGGVPGMAYMLENGQHKPISLSEFSTIPQDAIRHTCGVKIPDVAGRLTLLAFESLPRYVFTITDTTAWEKQIAQWQSEQWNTLIEIKSESMHGFSLFWHGEFQGSDTIFSTSQGFTTNFPDIACAKDAPWTIFAYSLPASEQVYQSAVLRHGAMHWMSRILDRYQEMVGHKLLLTLDRELNRQAQPWNWNITLEETHMLDAHFFTYLSEAEHAHRALFMSMGSQMNAVLGSNLTQRILSETFEQIHPEERAVLQSLRLIPAAFSE